MQNLTLKQRKFCDFYLESGNGTQSAIKAGYSERSAEVMASDNLRKPIIIDYINLKNRPQELLQHVTMSQVHQVWANIMLDEKQLTRDRLKASELIAKTYGAFLDRVEYSGEVGVTIINDIGDADDE